MSSASPNVLPPTSVSPDSASSKQNDNMNSRPQSPSSALDGLLNEGDIIGENIPLLGQKLSTINFPVSLSRQSSADERECEPALTFEVVRKLGTGSYAVVYLVREVLSNPPTDSIRLNSLEEEGMFDLDYTSSSTSQSSTTSPSTSATSATVYGREFAVKCLSKANLDEDALQAQLLEAHLHQSLPIHPNIVTLHRTLESPSYLILVLEYVPGQDLYYFLESARDQYHPPRSSNSGDSSGKTPTTPSLLSALHPTTLLSYTRLRLIASMFSQMCEAVAQCHRRGVYHRDIKPENLIVTDARSLSSADPGYRDQKVIVKLSDFGLATTDDESSDMDCGSAPYMSFECRNNLAPTYSPRQADVWSLGIVLINMLYHHNPWSDTSLQPDSACPSFMRYRALVLGEKEGRPEDFFRERFVGMSEAVATFLVRRVFCFIPVGEDARAVKAGLPGATSAARKKGFGKRVSAEEFGIWAKKLPELFGKSGAGFGERDGILVAPLIAPPKSRRPSLRANGAPSKPNHRILGLLRDISPSRGRSARPRAEHQRHIPQSSVDEEEDGPPKPDPEIDENDRCCYDEDEAENENENEAENVDEQEHDRPHSRATSATRRRRRGARRGRGSLSANVSVNGSTTNISATTQTSPTGLGIGFEEEVYRNLISGDHLDDMAVKSQLLARELSKTSSGWVGSNSSLAGKSTVSLTGGNKENISNRGAEGTSEKQVTQKKSRWKMFTSSSSNSSNANTSESVPPVPVVPNLAGSSQVPSMYSYPYTQTSPKRSTKSTGTSTSVAKSDIHSITGVSVTSSSAASVSTSRSRGKSSVGGGSGSTMSTGGQTSVNAVKATSLVLALGPTPRHSSPIPSTHLPNTASSSSLHLPPPSIGSSIHGSTLSLDGEERLRGWTDRSSIAKAAAAAMYPTPPPVWAPNPRLEQVPPPPPRKDRDRERRNLSPPSSSGPPSSASWRNSMSAASSSTASSSTAFTRYSNSSVKSVDTLATSHSGSSSNWRAKADLGEGASGKSKKANGSPAGLGNGGGTRDGAIRVPSNVKVMNGVPCSLSKLPSFTQLPRQLHVHQEGDIFGSPPVRKNNKSYQPQGLGTINEKERLTSSPPTSPNSYSNWRSGMKSSLDLNSSGGVGVRKDAATSTTDLTEDGDGPKKVQKGQINTLAKMLSALRR